MRRGTRSWFGSIHANFLVGCTNASKARAFNPLNPPRRENSDQITPSHKKTRKFKMNLFYAPVSILTFAAATIASICFVFFYKTLVTWAFTFALRFTAAPPSFHFASFNKF